MATFKIGISMAGAISAGAYTAGVLDFLTEALDDWYKAKADGEVVPMHDVSIEVITGASAGGMCAAISAVMLQEDFEHIHDTDKSGTTNRFYESWVNKIDIRELLKTDDLRGEADLVSLLDSSIVQQIAAYALNPGPPTAVQRRYVSQSLTLFLSLTNLRGIPYCLNGAAPGSLEESTLFYGDRIRFQTVSSAKVAPVAANVHTLDLSTPGVAGGWNVLQTAAMATGAFPAFLAPRALQRAGIEYVPPVWESVVSAAAGTPPPVAPVIPPEVASSFSTLNVDGGVTNNDPFNYALDYLLYIDPPCSNAEHLRNPCTADRAVISIAPFPTTEQFDPGFDPEKNSSIFSVLSKLFAALISQSRFFGESLDQIMNGTTFGRFVIAPSDDELVKKYRNSAGASSAKLPAALQCATIGAFGGFFERGFRAHDYALGRRNCQKFLRDYFVLPENNVLIDAAMKAIDPVTRNLVVKRFRRPPPGTYANSSAALQSAGQPLPEVQGVTDVWIPIIPLCSPAVSDPMLNPPPRFQMRESTLNSIVKLIMKRFKAVMKVFLGYISFWPLRVFLRIGQPVIRWLARRPLKKALIRQLGDSYRG
jgi:hypothetical protein